MAYRALVPEAVKASDAGAKPRVACTGSPRYVCPAWTQPGHEKAKGSLRNHTLTGHPEHNGTSLVRPEIGMHAKQAADEARHIKQVLPSWCDSARRLGSDPILVSETPSSCVLQVPVPDRPGLPESGNRTAPTGQCWQHEPNPRHTQSDRLKQQHNEHANTDSVTPCNGYTGSVTLFTTGRPGELPCLVPMWQVNTGPLVRSSDLHQHSIQRIQKWFVQPWFAHTAGPCALVKSLPKFCRQIYKYCTPTLPACHINVYAVLQCGDGAKSMVCLAEITLDRDPQVLLPSLSSALAVPFT